MSDEIKSRGIVKDFAQRMASKNTKTAQSDLGGGSSVMDELFKPEVGPQSTEKKPGKPEPKKPEHKKPEVGGDELGDIEKKSPLDECKDCIEKSNLSTEELDELSDFVAQKRIDLTDDGLDSEMDKGEALEKDKMRKDKPLGEAGNATMGYPAGSAGGGAMGAPKATGVPA